MSQHIFVSYKHEDEVFADMLMRQLQLAGFTVWLDTEHLRAGENWREAINQAIKEAFALVLVISPEAKSSEYVTYEWAFAQGAGIKVVPVLLRPTDNLHPQLEMLQYLDFTDRTRPPWDKTGAAAVGNPGRTPAVHRIHRAGCAAGGARGGGGAGQPQRRRTPTGA